MKLVEKEDEKVKDQKDDSTNVGVEDKKGKGSAEEDKTIEIKGRTIALQLDLEKPERDGKSVTVNKLHQQFPTKATREEPQAEKSGKLLMFFRFRDLKTLLGSLFLRDS